MSYSFTVTILTFWHFELATFIIYDQINYPIILVTRAPGKRRVKPTHLATEDFVLHDSDDDTDEEFGKFFLHFQIKFLEFSWS
jgi:hypothetical protein